MRPNVHDRLALDLCNMSSIVHLDTWVVSNMAFSKHLWQRRI